jgi:hypothetical protein
MATMMVMTMMVMMMMMMMSVMCTDLPERGGRGVEQRAEQQDQARHHQHGPVAIGIRQLPDEGGRHQPADEVTPKARQSTARGHNTPGVHRGR